VVRSGAGFHIVKVLERRQAGMPGAAVTQSHSRHILLRTGAQLTEAQARQKLADYKRRIESPARPTSSSWRARTRRTPAPATAATSAGPARACSCPSSRKCSMLQPGQIADPGEPLRRAPDPAAGAPPGDAVQREQREVVRNLVREKKLDEAYVQWAQEVRGRAYVEYREPPQ
jgi:peptidyl-prolyl cis-trans isomerase SurA